MDPGREDLDQAREEAARHRRDRLVIGIEGVVIGWEIYRLIILGMLVGCPLASGGEGKRCRRGEVAFEADHGEEVEDGDLRDTHTHSSGDLFRCERLACEAVRSQ